MKKILLLAMLFLGTSSVARAGACSSGTLDTYTASGFSCTIDGKTFSGWDYSATASGGASLVPASGVAVIPCPSASPFCSSIPTGEEGFIFTAAWGVTSGQTQDSVITYTVTSSSSIIDALLLYAGFGQTGTGFASVAETLSNGGSLFVSDPPGTPTSVTLTFAPGSPVTVAKAIVLAGGTSGTATISEVANGWSQSGPGVPPIPSNVYALSYYSNAHTLVAPDAALRLINDGNVSDKSPAGDLCASIYVFNNVEELDECCSCKITPNGLLTLSINSNLTSNTINGRVPVRGVVKLVTTSPKAGACDPTDNSAAQLQEGVHGFITHAQKTSTCPVIEKELTVSTPDSSELTDLAEDCKVAIELGSGRGVCSCSDAGL